MNNSTLVAIGIVSLASVCPSQVQVAAGNSGNQQQGQNDNGQNNNGQNNNDQNNNSRNNDQKKHAAAPEIDPAGAITALTLLAGGLAAVRGRRKKG